MNTAYKLFGTDGPEVSLEQTHRSRLDELSKCLAVAPTDAAVRLFWADAVISIAGPDMANWTYFIGSRAPSEQGMARLLMQNIEAAWQGNWWTRSFHEAKQAVFWQGGREVSGHDGNSHEDGQPIPGIFVWRTDPAEGEDWETWSATGWPSRPTAESTEHFLKRLITERGGAATVVGILLDVDGVDLQFLSTRPLSLTRENGKQEGPTTSVTVLGGPKGISPSVKNVVRDAFKTHSVPLLEVCLGPEEQMAHACVAYLRLQDDAGRFRPAVQDLLNLGRQGYARLRELVDGALVSVSASLHTLQVKPTIARSRSRSRSPSGGTQA